MKMTTKQSLKYQLLAAQCGFAFEILYTIFWGWMGHNLPPASASLSAQELATHFAMHHNAILFGNSMAALVGALWIPWTAQHSNVANRRVEPSFDDHPVNRGHAYRLGSDVWPRDMGDCGVPAGD
jgi:hypothetical protein